MQFVFAGFILWMPPGLTAPIGSWLSSGASLLFDRLQDFVESGSTFLFGIYPRDTDPDLPPPVTLLRSFAFGVLPTIIVFSSLMSVLYYFAVTYALSGFSNFGAIRIQIGGLAPSRRSDLAPLGLRAMIGGALACCMTARVAGILI